MLEKLVQLDLHKELDLQRNSEAQKEAVDMDKAQRKIEINMEYSYELIKFLIL